MSTNVGRKVYLGDPAKHQAVLNSVTAAHNAVEGGVETLTRLADERGAREPSRAWIQPVINDVLRRLRAARNKPPVISGR